MNFISGDSRPFYLGKGHYHHIRTPMPELPEVETYRLELAPELNGRTVLSAQVFWPNIIAEPDVKGFEAGMANQQFGDFGRRGKYLLLNLVSGQTLIIHLRMTGEIHIHPPSVERDKHTHVTMPLDDGRILHYRDQRKFGRLWLVDEPESVLFRLGPEPLEEEFTPIRLAKAIHGRKATIKALLLDQSVVAGVGNIYADEALFRARIEPRRAGGTLTEDDCRALRDQIRVVLEMGIEKRGSSLQNYVRLSGMKGGFQDLHQVFRKTGQPCPVCETPIERVIVAQRSTHFCPNCQK